MYKSMGVIIGVAVGLVLCVILFRFINKDKRLKTEYDEMQDAIRNRGFKYAFFTLLIYEAVMCIISIGIEELPVEPYLVHFGAIAIGVTMHACYSIWNDAYIGLNTKTTRFIVIMAVIAIFNLFWGAFAIASGRMMEDGIVQPPFLNLMCGAMFVIIGATALIHKLTKQEVEE